MIVQEALGLCDIRTERHDERPSANFGVFNRVSLSTADNDFINLIS